jgi:hypothetical protein
MDKLLIILIFLGLSNKSFSQVNDSLIQHDYIIGAWYDSTKVSTGGSGFIFTPDSCCSVIINGEMTDCMNESKKVKVLYQINYRTNPKQLDIKFADLKTDSIKGIISMIFEIIDRNHIRLAINKGLDNKRPIDFRIDTNSEISIMTRYIENKNKNAR